MSQRQLYPFRPIRGSTAPSFQAGTTAVFTSTAQTFQNSSNRVWAGPMRTIRVAEKDGIDSWVNWGTSLVEASSAGSVLLLGGTVEAFHIEPNQTYFAVKSESTTTGVRLNVTLGYGG